ncbi:BRO family protein [Lactonifactor longoviformis]|uniref:BRO family protein n=1 Tax=Lactonifactor longoviformis TaxID=341220 RepID=UPI001D0084D7|nr:BRO family protein [Lactonifactor longoviformis]MCB5713619.1 phage antirepressor KilAC domain-containing protein [Lactonifactor longoviformis]MCB5717718.1 phage antirepressor KilAC domain-containing protein [Lactonifactor longoviformis]
MHEIKIFENEEFGQVRTLLIGGEPWFVGRDIAEILKYSNTRKAIADHVDDDDKTDGVTIRDAIGRSQKPIIINESGLYSLILSSKLPNAKKFKRWVTSEVLPSIRKHGAYIIMPKLEEIMANPESLELLLKQLLAETQKNKKLEQQLTVFAPKGEYYDRLIETEMLTNLRITAHELGIKPMAFTQFLLDNKYVYRDTQQKVLPYQPYIHEGVFVIKDFRKNGFHGKQTLITVYGKLYLLTELKKENRI